MIRIRYLSAVPYGWVVVALCVMATIPAAFTYTGMGVLFPFIQEELEINRAQIGLIPSGMFAGGIATILLVGWLVDVVGVRRLQSVGLLGMALALLLFSQIDSLLYGVLAAVLIGITPSASYPAQNKAIMEWVRQRTRGLAMGIREASLQVGGMVAALLLTYLAVTFGWRSAVMTLAVITVVSGILFLAFYRDKPGSNPHHQQEIKSGGKPPPMSQNRDLSLVSFLSATLSVAKDRNILLVSSLGATLSGGYTVLVTYLVLFLREDQEMSAGAAGGLLAVAMAGGAVSRVGWGLVSDRMLGGRRVGPLAIVGALSVLSFALMALIPSSASLGLVSATVFFVGITAMGWSGLLTVLIAELAVPAVTGTAIGFAGLLMGVGAFGITPVFGLVVDRTGSYHVAWWLMAALTGGGTLLLALLSRGALTSGRHDPTVRGHGYA